MTSSTPMPTTGSLQLVEAVVGGLDGAPVGERRQWCEDFKAMVIRAALEFDGTPRPVRYMRPRLPWALAKRY